MLLRKMLLVTIQVIKKIYREYVQFTENDSAESAESGSTNYFIIINNKLFHCKMYFKDKRFHFNRTFKREILQTHKTSPNIE